MTTLTNTSPAKNYARLAGLLYLLIALTGGFSIGYVPSVIVEEGNAAQTVQNMMDHSVLFGLGMVGDVAVILMELVLTVLLFRMFQSVNKTVSYIALFSRFAMGIVMALNLLNYIIPMLLVNDPGLLTGFSIDQSQSLAFLFMDAHQYGVYVWGLFFALHLVALGYLLIKSGFSPKWMGILMMVGSLGYFGESLTKLTFQTSDVLGAVLAIFLAISVVGELSYTFWLLIKGTKSE